MKPLTLLLLLAAIVLTAEPVQLRKGGNIVTFEYVTQDEDTITVQVPGKDSVLTYKWDDLDQEWTKKNSPKVWAERDLLLKPAKEEAMEKKKKATEPEEDPFAKEATPTDTKSLLRNLSVSMLDGLKGVQITNVDFILKEGEIEEATFWKTFSELKAASKPAPEAKEKAEMADKSDKADKEMADKSEKPEAKKTDKAKATSQKSKNGTTNNPAKTPQRPEQFKTFEENAKKDYEAEKKSFAAIGYFRLLAEGGVKAKTTWAMLRRAPDDRKALVTMLRKYEVMAGELAEKPDAKASRNDNLALKKHLQNAADSIEKVNRETLVMELRLSNDCQTILSHLAK
ncbi:MAG: hypothetical protein NTX41_04880 [Verrucomicrobia bacterium]|nr:hypothetical protein [Verrucomicrobiota bacterium]